MERKWRSKKRGHRSGGGRGRKRKEKIGEIGDKRLEKMGKVMRSRGIGEESG